MTAASTSNSFAFRQILDNFNTSPPPSNQHHHLPDHLYLEPLQPIHEQPPSLIPRPRPMDRQDRQPLHHRASSSVSALGASAHAAGSGTATGPGSGGNGHARTPTTSRPKHSSSSMSAAAAASAPLKARVNTSSIVSLADVAQPTLRRKTPSTLSMRSESNTPARSQSPLHVSSSRSAVGSTLSSGQISPDKPTVRVAKVSPQANMASARLQRAASMRSSPGGSPSPAGTSASGTPATSGPSTRRNSAQTQGARARSPPSLGAPSQLGSAFGSAIASLSSSQPPRRASDDPRMRRPSASSGSMTGERPVHVRNASVVSLGKPPLESRHTSPIPKAPPLETRRSVPAVPPHVPAAPPLERGHSGLAEVTPDEVNETTPSSPPSRSPQAASPPPPRHHRQSSLLSPSTMVPEVLPNPPPLPEEDEIEPSSNRSSPVRPTRPLDPTSPHFRPVFASAFPPASAPTSPIPRNLPISPDKQRRPSKMWTQGPPNHVPTPGSPNMKTVALPAITPTMSPSEGHRELHPAFRLEENLHQLSVLHSHEAAHHADPVSPLSGMPQPILQSPPEIGGVSPLTSPPVTSSPGDDTDDIEKAKVNRKIADLEISNSSLLSINKTLEKTKALQRAEIVKLRRRLREQDLPPLRDAEGGLGLSAPELSDEDDGGNMTDPELESRWDRLIDMVTVMRRAGEEAILAKKSGRAVLPWLDLEGEKAESVAGSIAVTEGTEVTEQTETETEVGTDAGTDAGTETGTEAGTDRS